MKHLKTLAWGILPLATLILVSWLGSLFPLAFFILFSLGVAYAFGALFEHLWETRHW